MRTGERVGLTGLRGEPDHLVLEDDRPVLARHALPLRHLVQPVVHVGVVLLLADDAHWDLGCAIHREALVAGHGFRALELLVVVLPPLRVLPALAGVPCITGRQRARSGKWRRLRT